MNKPTEDQLAEAFEVVEEAVSRNSDLTYERDRAEADLKELKDYARTMRVGKRLERMAETLNKLEEKVWKANFGFFVLGVIISSIFWLVGILKAL